MKFSLLVPQCRGHIPLSPLQVLVVLLLVGLVVSSPLPETEGQSSPSNDGREILDAINEAKSLPLLQTVSFSAYGESDVTKREEGGTRPIGGPRLQTNPLDDFDDLVPVSITSPTMFSNGGKTPSNGHLSFAASQDASFGGEDKNGQMESESLPKPEVGGDFQPKDFHVTSEVRTVQFQIVKKSHQNAFLPPMVFAQHSPDMNLEPTEVEAPGTTPTTIAMVTDSMPLTTYTVYHVPLTTVNKSQQVFDTLIRKADNPNKPKLTPSKVISHSIEESEFPQRDEPRKLVLDNYPGQTVVRDRNQTAKYIKDNLDSAVVYIKNHSPLKQQTDGGWNNGNEQKAFEDIIADDIIEDSLSFQSDGAKSNFEKESKSDGTISSGLHIFKPLSDMALQAEALTSRDESNISKDSNAAEIGAIAEDKFSTSDHISDETTVENHKPFLNQSKSIIVLDKADINEPTTVQNYETATEPDSIMVTMPIVDSDERDTVPEVGVNAAKETSNIEIREANDESYFSSLGNGGKSEGGRSPNEETESTPPPQVENTTVNDRIKMEVYTASSEINYRNFNPEINTSSIIEPEIPLASTHDFSGSRRNQTIPSPPEHLDHGKPLEEPHISKVKVTYNEMDSTSMDNSGVEGKKGEEILRRGAGIPPPTENPVATNSSKSREAAVKSIKVNVSSPSTSEDMIRSSGRIIKAPHDSGPLPKVLDSDSLETAPLGVYPSKPSLSPPMQQERVSVPISEAINKSMTAASVAGIVMGVLLTVFIVAGGAGFYYYHRQMDIRPKVLSSDRSCANSDSGGYLDDQCRVAYVNSQGTPEDLVSLDNDSFLNSLESMTIQNLWTDSIRHTKL